jgi:hypothetical protein
MSRTTQTTIRNADAVAREAIAIYLGDISSLPRAVKNRIFEVYGAFFTAYINIGRIKGISENEALENVAEMDEDLINYMQHFFSDYQDIYRGFIDLNRHAKALMQIDGIKHPKQFDEHVSNLLAGRNLFSDEHVFNQLHVNPRTDEQQQSDENPSQALSEVGKDDP